MSNVTQRGPVKPTLNITPLIDVVFLLIVFFLLVNNIVTDDVPEMKLPDIEKPVTAPLDSDNRIIVNVLPKVEWDGDPGPGTPIPQVLQREGQAQYIRVFGVNYDVEDPDALKAFMEEMKKAIAIRRGNNLRFLFRVDAAIYYYQVLPVMDALQTAMAEAGLDPEKGETMIDIVAYMPD